jgi:Ca2+-binding EF-hand superfamily protein
VSGGKLDRKESMRKRAGSVTALDNVTVIDIYEDEMIMLQELHAELDALTKHTFTMDELARLFADFKMNNSHITENDFSIIFATFSRTGTSEGIADVAFNMLDISGDGNLEFSDFIKFLAVLVKGEQEEKLKLCFKLFSGGVR